MSSTNFSAFNASFLLLVSSNRSSEEEMSLLAKDSRNYQHMGLALIFKCCICANVQLAVYLAKTPSPSLCLEMESFEHG